MLLEKTGKILNDSNLHTPPRKTVSESAHVVKALIKNVLLIKTKLLLIIFLIFLIPKFWQLHHQLL